jgi:MraZ protein
MGTGGIKWDILQNMLIGNYIHTLDPKKRLSIPAKWRSSLGEKVVMTSGLDQSLFVFSEIEWKKIAEKLVSLGFMDADSRQFARYMLANAFELSIDSHGRVLVPETLAKTANLKDEVVLAGVYSRIEVWDKDKYDILMSSTSKSADEMALRIAKLGIE